MRSCIPEGVSASEAQAAAADAPRAHSNTTDQQKNDWKRMAGPRLWPNTEVDTDLNGHRVRIVVNEAPPRAWSSLAPVSRALGMPPITV